MLPFHHFRAKSFLKFHNKIKNDFALKSLNLKWLFENEILDMYVMAQYILSNPLLRIIPILKATQVPPVNTLHDSY